MKCGGNTINDFFKENNYEYVKIRALTNTDIFEKKFKNNTIIDFCRGWRNDFFTIHDILDIKKKININNKNVYLITLLRDPKSYSISFFNHCYRATRGDMIKDKNLLKNIFINHYSENKIIKHFINSTFFHSFDGKDELMKKQLEFCHKNYGKVVIKTKYDFLDYYVNICNKNTITEKEYNIVLNILKEFDTIFTLNNLNYQLIEFCKKNNIYTIVNVVTNTNVKEDKIIKINEIENEINAFKDEYDKKLYYYFLEKNHKENMYNDVKNLYPICRSITGEGIKITLDYIKKQIPINIHNIKSGTKIFDWEVPKEWNIKNAYIKNSKGKKILDLNDHYLHILNYSVPKHIKLNLEELKKHIFTIPEFPDWIPYRTSYYKENWGFCMKHNEFLKLEDDTYEVFIDSSLENGYMPYGDLIIKGKSQKEILISSYCCHPQQCNDSLSGTVLAMHLAKYLLKIDNYYTYRFIFIPETIGSIVYLYKNLDIMKKNVIGGYVITCVGDEGEFTYLKTKNENQFIDKITLFLLNKSGQNYKVRDFYTCGSDERQYNYPGINLNIGSLMKTKYHEFDEYHTSADNLEFVTAKGLNDTYNFYIKCLNLIEQNFYYINTKLCEPMLGKYGLYNMIGAIKDPNANIGDMCIKILYYCDGSHDLIDIDNKLNIGIDNIIFIIKKLIKNNLIIIYD